jgi:hypothetical protein
MKTAEGTYIVARSENTYIFCRNEVVTAVVMKSTIFRDITQCSLLKVNRVILNLPSDFTLVYSSAYSALEMFL